MARHNNELDELIEYQEKQYLPHANHIQNGKLPYPMRQLAKQPGKAAVLYLLLLPGILVVVMGALSRFLEDLGDTGSLISGITAAAVAILYIIVIVYNFRKAKRIQREAQAQKKQQKRRKKRR